MNNLLKISYYFVHDFFKTTNSLIHKLDQIQFTKISGVLSSKSDDYWYKLGIKNLYEASKYIDDIPKESKQNFLDSCYHIDRRISKCTYDLYYTEWDEKYFWSNIDRSHHLATAIYQSIKHGFQHIITAKVTNFSINESEANKLLSNFYDSDDL